LNDDGDTACAHVLYTYVLQVESVAGQPIPSVLAIPGPFSFKIKTSMDSSPQKTPALPGKKNK
jgi:hypothetical protein